MTQTALIYDGSGDAGCAIARDILAEGFQVAFCVQGHATARSQKQALAEYPAGQVSIHQVLDGRDEMARVFRACAKELLCLDHIIVLIDLRNTHGSAFGAGGLRRNLDIAQAGILSMLTQCDAAMQLLKRQEKGQLSLLFLSSAHDGNGTSSTTMSQACLAAANKIVEGVRAEVRDSKIAIDCTEFRVGNKNTGELAAVRQWAREIVCKKPTEIPRLLSAATA